MYRRSILLALCAKQHQQHHIILVFQVVYFGDHVILNEPIEDWPVVDVLIAFFSKGYPLDKAVQYAALRKPHILNDLHQQSVLQDRRRVYDLLQASGIDVPRHVYLSRDGYVSTAGVGDGNGNREQQVHEFDDHIECNGVVIHKPFVEKPVNAEDHNISIYYPTSTLCHLWMRACTLGGANLVLF
jgi:inositol-hexakisphosphate/diphosphoinositol-pentakisphosphate 1-kinase